MFLQRDVSIRAPRKRVWDVLTDPNPIGACVPGVEQIEIIVLNNKSIIPHSED